MKRDESQSCPEIRDRIPLFVGGDLDPEALDSVRAHLARCEACARYAGDASRSRQVLVTSFRERGAALPRARLWTDVRDVLVAEGRIGPIEAPLPKNAPVGVTGRPRLRLVRYAAGLAAAAAVLVFAVLHESRQPTSDVVDTSGPALAITLPEAGGLRRVAPDEERPLGAPEARERPHLHPERGLPLGTTPSGGAELAGFK